MTSFYKNILTVLTGTGIAQLIPVLGSLIIVRIFSPSIFGEYAFWLSLTLILTVIVSGRFETCIAVKAPGFERNKAVFYTFVTIIVGTLFFTLFFLPICFGLLGFGTISQPVLMILVPITAGITAAIQLIISYYASEGLFNQLSLVRIVQSALILSFQVFSGLIFPDNIYSLILSHFFALIFTIVTILYCFNLRFDFRGLKFRELFLFWKENRKYLQYSLPADTISTVSAELPIMLAVTKFGSDVGGIMALTFRVLGAPIALVAKAVLDVFKKFAADEYRQKGNCKDTFFKTFKVLSILSCIFFIISNFVIKDVFQLAFGSDWAESGDTARILLLLFAMRFVASPLSYVVYITESQEIDLYWQITLLVVTTLSFTLFSTINQALHYYNFGYSFLYLVYLLMCFKMASGNVRK